MIAAPRIDHAEFSLKRNIAIKLTSRIEIVSQSVIEDLPSCHAATAIRASEPATTPSNTAPAKGSADFSGSKDSLARRIQSWAQNCERGQVRAGQAAQEMPEEC